jgi:ABC-2 type transport system ATP-binding protein
MSTLHALPGYLTFGGLRPAAAATAASPASAGTIAASCPEPGNAVEVDRLYVRRGGRTVLREVSLRIPRGSVTGLLGPSGCGKSTLIRSIMGVQVISGGSVTVLGRPAGSPDLRPRVGYVTQAPALYDDLTVEENLGYFARLLGVTPERIEEVLVTVDLDRARGRVTRDLSGGQRARVSLATALLGDPELLVLDEPTVGLDPVLRRNLWTTFEELAARGTTLLVSSHVMDEAARCDELLLMREGALLATESPQRLRDRTGRQDLEEAFLRIATEVA